MVAKYKDLSRRLVTPNGGLVEQFPPQNDLKSSLGITPGGTLWWGPPVLTGGREWKDLVLEVFFQPPKIPDKEVPGIIGCFQKEGYPQIINFNRVFHYKPSILGYPYFWKHPIIVETPTFKDLNEPPLGLIEDKLKHLELENTRWHQTFWVNRSPRRLHHSIKASSFSMTHKSGLQLAKLQLSSVQNPWLVGLYMGMKYNPQL